MCILGVVIQPDGCWMDDPKFIFHCHAYKYNNIVIR